MTHISSFGSSPEPISTFPSTVQNAGANASQKTPSTVNSGGDEAQTSPLQAQLSRLGAVLSGLQAGANLTRAQYVQAYQKVKSGSYHVTSTEVSRSLVDDMLN